MPEGINRPKLPRASGFTVTVCGDPDCGPHFLIEVDGKQAIEMIWSREGTLDMIRILQDALYCKAVEDDGK